MSNRPLMERVALGYFEKLNAARAVRTDNRVHLLDAGELAELRSIERWAIFRSAMAGALSSLVAGAAEVYADTYHPAAQGAGLTLLLTYWGIVLGATVVASIFEIVYLYWDALRSVHQLAAAAGLPIRTVEGEGVAVALARAALELPTPTTPVLGVDPRREASRLRLLLIALLYKGKIALTSFLLKLLLRRVMTRAAVRMLPFVSVPVTAVWNGLVTWRVVREARIRALGPSALQEVLPQLLDGVPAQGPVREAMLRAVASSIVRTQELHPNLHELLIALSLGVNVSAIEALDSPARFISLLGGLAPEDQRAVLRLLSVAAVIDGRLSGRERRLVTEASRACGIDSPLQAVARLGRGFAQGEGFRLELLEGLSLPPGMTSPAIARAG